MAKESLATEKDGKMSGRRKTGEGRRRNVRAEAKAKARKMKKEKRKTVKKK